jgi:hypothetical protein
METVCISRARRRDGLRRSSAASCSAYAWREAAPQELQEIVTVFDA